MFPFNDLKPAAGYTVDELSKLLARGLRFHCVLADPPWQYDRDPRGAAAHHYPTMCLEEIEALPVARLAADDAHLHLWTTHSFLFEAQRVMRAWGFEYKSIFVWTKPSPGTGYYWRNAAEFLLLGVRGQCPFLDHSIINWICVGRGQHSEKPERIRTLIEAVSPPPYLELFGRRPAEGWVVWGNQITRGLFDYDIAAIE